MPTARKSRTPESNTALQKPGTLLAQWLGMLGKLAVEELDDLDPEIGRLVTRLKQIAGDGKKTASPKRRRATVTAPAASPAAEVVVDAVAVPAKAPKRPRAKKPLGRKPQR